MYSTPYSIFIVHLTEYLTVYVAPDLIFWYSASNSKYAICSPSCLLSLETLLYHYLQFWLRLSELFFLFPGGLYSPGSTWLLLLASFTLFIPLSLKHGYFRGSFLGLQASWLVNSGLCSVSQHTSRTALLTPAAVY